MIKRAKVLWRKEAEKLGADIERVQVWDAFSELFLDSYRTEEELQHLAEIIADSPFSNDELEHILRQEVAPVCAGNLFCWPGGEWLMFPPDELIAGCLRRQVKHPYKPGLKKTYLLEILREKLFYGDALSLLGRVKHIRQGRL